MGLIEDELLEVKRLCENVVEGSKLVSCVKIMVRVEIKRTDFKNLVVCMQFPPKYPQEIILVELKSKTLHDKLLLGLTKVVENEAKNYVGKTQVLHVLKFLRNFLDENPLCCCYDEINKLKALLDEKNNDELKLKQKNSCVSLKCINKQYYLNAKIRIPDNYPTERVSLDDFTTNLSPSLQRHISCQFLEIARQCVEPPLYKKPPKNQPPFKPLPSLLKSTKFLIESVKNLPQEHCQICEKPCLDQDPNFVETDENAPLHVERVYCGHLFHLECLNKYMKTPPFGNKRCKVCNLKISHHKWKLSDKLAEDRWAHEQARERELAEVEDFFK